MPSLHRALTKKEELRGQIFDLEAKKLEGVQQIHVIDGHRDQPIDERIANLRKGIDVIDPIFRKQDRWRQIKYSVSKWSFIVGITAILLSRAYVPFLNIIRSFH